MENISKSELIKAIAKKTDKSQREVTPVVDTFISEIMENVAAGKKVQFVGFGTFESRHRSARQGRNPQTGEPIEIAATDVPAFKPGKGFKDLLKK